MVRVDEQRIDDRRVRKNNVFFYVTFKRRGTNALWLDEVHISEEHNTRETTTAPRTRLAEANAYHRTTEAFICQLKGQVRPQEGIFLQGVN